MWSRSATWTTTSTTAQYTASICTPGTQSTWANTQMWWEVANFYKEWLFNCCWTQIESFKPLLPLLRQRFQLRSSFREVAQVKKDHDWWLQYISNLWCQGFKGFHWTLIVLNKRQFPFVHSWTKDSFLLSNSGLKTVSFHSILDKRTIINTSQNNVFVTNLKLRTKRCICCKLAITRLTQMFELILATLLLPVLQLKLLLLHLLLPFTIFHALDRRDSTVRSADAVSKGKVLRSQALN